MDAFNCKRFSEGTFGGFKGTLGVMQKRFGVFKGTLDVMQKRFGVFK